MPSDFLPGYVYTISSDNFKNLNEQIIIVGQEDGKIYGKFNDKNELFQKIYQRKTRNHMMCYYKNDINFSPMEKDMLWAKNIFPISKREAEKIKLVNLFI